MAVIDDWETMVLILLIVNTMGLIVYWEHQGPYFNW